MQGRAWRACSSRLPCITMHMANWLLLVVLVAAHLSLAAHAGASGAAAPLQPPGAAAPLQPPQQQWCAAQQAANASSVHWLHAPLSPETSFFAQQDVYTCQQVALPAAELAALAAQDSSIVAAALRDSGTIAAQGAAGLQLSALQEFAVLECDASSLWFLRNALRSPDMCAAYMDALLVACTQWALPAAKQLDSIPTRALAPAACAPPGHALASAAQLQQGNCSGRVVLLLVHWSFPESMAQQAVSSGSLELSLGHVAKQQQQQHRQEQQQHQPRQVQQEHQHNTQSPRPQQQQQQQEQQQQELPIATTARAAALHPPSAALLQHPQQALRLLPGMPHQSATFSCPQRCTYVPLSGVVHPQPVRLLGLTAQVGQHASGMSVQLRRCYLSGQPDVTWQLAVGGRSGEGGALAATFDVMGQSVQIHPGDVLDWTCHYNTTSATTPILGGPNTASGAEERCNLLLHYEPTVPSALPLGCLASGGRRIADSMCVFEARAQLADAQEDSHLSPIRAIIRHDSFGRHAWSPSWSATLAFIITCTNLAFLWACHTALAAGAFGRWLRLRYLTLPLDKRRNVPVYITHLVLDTVCVVFWLPLFVQVWCMCSDAAGHVRNGELGLLYLAVSYLMELTWRQRIDSVLVAHHSFTALGILVMGGELAWLLIEVGDITFVLLLFGVLEQPMYVALLMHRLAPHTEAARRHLLRAWSVACWFWVVSKALSVVLSLTFFVVKWPLMAPWMRVTIGASVVGISVIQARAGAIFFGIRRSVRRGLWKASHAAAHAAEEDIIGSPAPSLPSSRSGAAADGGLLGDDEVGRGSQSGPSSLASDETPLADGNCDILPGADAKSEEDWRHGHGEVVGSE